MLSDEMIIRSAQSGFSLVELSIVLVILGLLTGGILGGQSLIRAAELRAVTSEFSRYRAAVYTFRDKYFAMPGDMANATAFWGSMTNCTAASPSGTGTQTCDGNGNGTLTYAPAAGRVGEAYLFWQHLANAGLIEGRYNGIAGSSGTTDHIIGVNSPASRISGTGWNANSTGTFAGSVEAFAGEYGTRLNIGAKVPNVLTKGPFLAPEEAWNIDTKVDDGKPGRGFVMPNYWDDCTDAASSTDLDANYLLTQSGRVCGLYLLRI